MHRIEVTHKHERLYHLFPQDTLNISLRVKIFLDIAKTCIKLGEYSNIANFQNISVYLNNKIYSVCIFMCICVYMYISTN